MLVEVLQHASQVWALPMTAQAQFRRDVEAAQREGKIGHEKSGRLLRFFEHGLHGYTYLEEPDAGWAWGGL